MDKSLINSTMSELSSQEMKEINGGFPWAFVIEGVISNWADIKKGVSDAWND